MTPRHRRAAWALLALAILGCLDSIYLVVEHVRVRGALGGSSACDLGERLNCAAAALSRYAEVSGVPIATLGAAYYAGVVLLLVMALAQPVLRLAVAPILAATSALATTYSLFLLAVSVSRLTAICPACTLTYLINGAMLAASLVWLGPGIAENLKEARTQAGPAVVLLATLVLVIVACTAVGTVWTHKRIAAGPGVAATVTPPAHPALSPAEVTALAHVPYAPSMGPAGAPVLIVVFSDFECPHCARFAATLRRLHRNYGDSVRIEYRSFPLPMHKHAELAARLGVCAEAQGKFWSFHDLVFEKQDNLNPETLPEIADDAGLDVHAAMACAEREQTRQTVAADIAAGEKLGITGTPSFVLNGELTIGAALYDDLEQRIGQLLQSNERAQLAP